MPPVAAIFLSRAKTISKQCKILILHEQVKRIYPCHVVISTFAACHKPHLPHNINQSCNRIDREPAVQSRILLIVLLLTSTTLSAETYRWVNEDGVVTYSQTPPPEGKADVVKTYSAPSSDAAAAKQRLQKLRQDLADREEDRALKKAEIQENKKSQKIREDNCKTARSNLQTLRSLANRLYKSGDEYLRLTEEQKQERIQEAQKQIEEYCK
ncbi:MAG: hypothetical protein B6D70_10380 [gamma proteobacterium symbiont of Stewartia floridana]|nr:MAG: hypothetical protein B6D70_10380 [gamma proteobacterium symbiont of Stewartia floridana]RLW69616.1 MAG: hypothetical protein B6D71_09530 [gamma proteobacterium symbiont of Stewartia floridana]